MVELFEDEVKDEYGNIKKIVVKAITYDIYLLIYLDEVIYVGVTSNIKNRINCHKSVRKFDSYMVFASETDKHTASRIERLCIRLLANFSENRLQNKHAANDLLKYRTIMEYVKCRGCLIKAT